MYMTASLTSVLMPTVGGYMYIVHVYCTCTMYTYVVHNVHVCSVPRTSSLWHHRDFWHYWSVQCALIYICTCIRIVWCVSSL